MPYKLAWFLLFLALAGCGEDQRLQAVRAQLKDPASAQFRDVRNYGTKTCGYVNAKNELGGYTGFQRFAVIGDGPDRMVVIATPSDAYIVEQSTAHVCHD